MTQLEAAMRGMNRALSAFRLAAVMLAFVGLGLVFGPELEARLFPVWTDMQAHVMSRSDDRMVIDWWGMRQRPTCLHVSTAFLVKRDATTWVLADISAAGDKGDGPLRGTTRPPGWQQLRQLDVIPAGSAVVIQMRHQCHSLWQTVTHVPEIALP